jgi:long-chain acyl-CoA synthetase
MATAIPYRPSKPGTIYQSQIDRTLSSTGEYENTLPKNFLLRVRELGDRVAMRKKRFGVWQKYTWDDVYEHVSNVNMALVSLGLKAGETVAIIGDNDPEFFWTQIAVHSARCKTIGVFSDATPTDLEYVLSATEAVFLFAQDQEQVDKALALKDQVPHVRKVIYWEDKGMWSYDDDWLMSYEHLASLGQAYKQQNPGLYEKQVAETEPEDVIILSMTSGTSSLPKFAMCPNTQYILGDRLFSPYIPMYQQDNWVSFSPLAWQSEQAFGFAPHLIHGFAVNFPESPETVPTDLREIAPVALVYASRLWENLASTIQVRINDSLWINRFLYKAFMPVAYKIIDLEDQGQSVGIHWRFLRWLGELAVFEPLRDKIGLTRARWVITLGAVLSPDVVRFYRAIGVELRQLYASTETFCTLHLEGDVSLESVGTILPGVEVKIADDREILIRTTARFAGYYEDPEKTGEAICEEGWYHTGDAGYMREDGHLIYLDRMKDLIQLASGESFSPQYIEGRLKFSPYIQDAMAIGGMDMDFVTAMITIDFDNVARWAEKNGIGFTTFVDLSQKPEVYDLIQQDVERVNQSLPPAARVKKFVNLHKAFDADEAELTRTRKLRRHVLYQKYDNMLEAMYGDSSEVRVSAEVKYRDGRTGTVETAVRVAELN